MRKLAVIGLQQTFLQLVYEQIRELVQNQIWVRTVALNELEENPLLPGETVLYFSKGLKSIVEKLAPRNGQYIHARRENLIYNMRDLFALKPGRNILVVNDVKSNTDEMTRDLRNLDLEHTFLPYYPDRPLPGDIDLVVTAGERMLVPSQLKDKPVLDIGLRFISLETVYMLFDHFNLPYTHAALARHYMRTMMMLSEKWPVLGEDRFKRPNWFGYRQDTSASVRFEDFIQNSPAMASFCRDALKMAATDTPVHIFGQIGTGKIQIAQAIHNASAFGGGPFVSVNCAARTTETIERELFGWEIDGATYKSLFETAEYGTLCIEEISKLPEQLQARLLQAVTEKKIIRTDGKGVVDVQVRLITTSSQPLDKLAPDQFLPELLLMITQHICRVPSLNERLEDIETLVCDYIKKQLRKPRLTVPPETWEALKAHVWEGNVQELYHSLQHAVCMSEDVLAKQHLPFYITRDSVLLSGPKNRADQPPAEPKEEFSTITRHIVTHGFLDESREILAIYRTGKEKHLAYGRNRIQTLLQEKGIVLSRQQLRLKLERMDKLGLLIVRPGRGGTTISEKGERYLKTLTGSY